MIFNILTLFPQIFPGPLEYSLIGKGLKKGLFEINTVDIRDYAFNNSKSVDDAPFGGGPGMIIKPDVLQNAIKSVKKSKTFYFSPTGKKIDQKFIHKLSKEKEITLICGRYEGVDQRFLDFNKIEEISVGDYIISGGEIASFILIDACVRLIPKVLGNTKSLDSESFHNNLLEYSQYTKPSEWNKMSVPEVLLSGNHKKISNWRLKNSLEKTKKVRPDLYKLYLQDKKRKI